MTVQVEAPAEETHENRARRNVEAVNRDAGPNPIRIGVLTPLTPPGDPTAGELISRGARIGAEYVREHGGVLGGRNVELLLVNDVEGADDTTMGKTAVEGLKRLDEQGAVAAFGQWHLRTSGAVSAATEKLGLPMFVENGDSDATRRRRAVFRTYFSIANRAPVMMEFLASVGMRRLAVVASDTVFSQTTANEVERVGAEHV